MQAMTNPKLDKALRLLVAIEREPQSSYALAGTLGTALYDQAGKRDKRHDGTWAVPLPASRLQPADASR